MDSKRGSTNPIAKFVRAVQMVNFMLKNKITSDDLFVLTKIALEKPIRQRTENDFQMIERYVGRLACGFKMKLQFGPVLFRELCKNLYYSQSEINKTVININHEGKTFFVILRGRVSVNIYLPVHRDGHEEFQQTEVNSLSAGQTFGELALLDDVTKTTATIITKTSCEFACVDRFQFKRILGEIQSQELQTKIDFLKKLSFLKGWFDQDLKTLSYHFDKIQYNRHQEIFREGMEAKYIYIIHNGEFLLQKNMEFIPPHEDTDINKCIRQVQNFKTLVICKMNEGEIFGEEELLGITLRQFTVTANLYGSEVYRINKVDLERRLWVNSSMKILKNLTQDKAQWRMDMYHQQRLSLLAEFESKLQDRSKQMTQLKNLLNPTREKIINPLEKQRVYQGVSKQASIQRVGQKPSTMIFNFMEAGRTLDHLKESQSPQHLNRTLRKSKTAVAQKTRNSPQSAYNPPLYEKYMLSYKQKDKKIKSKETSVMMPTIDTYEPIEMVNSRLRFMSEDIMKSYQVVDLGNASENLAFPEQRLLQFMNIMDKNYADDNIDWGGDGTKESLDENRQLFYRDLKKYAEVNKFTLRDITEASSKKAAVLEQEFHAIQEREKNRVEIFKQQQVVNKSDNQINKEYFIKQLMAMQKRLQALSAIKQGLLMCRADQYVNASGKIVDKKRSSVDEIDTPQNQYNFSRVSHKHPPTTKKQTPFGSEMKVGGGEHSEKINQVDTLIDNLKLQIKIFKKRNSEQQEPSVQVGGYAPVSQQIKKRLKQQQNDAPLFKNTTQMSTFSLINYNLSISQTLSSTKLLPFQSAKMPSTPTSQLSTSQFLGQRNYKILVREDQNGIQFKRTFNFK